MRPFHLPTVPGPAAPAPFASRLADRLSAAGFVFLALLIGLGGGVPAPAGAAEPTRAVVSYVEDREGVAILELDGDYDRFGDGGGENVEPRQMVARELYLHHADEVDLLIVFTTFDFDTGPEQAFHTAVQNEVQGIGLDSFDDTALWGSDGRLLGYIDMAWLDDLITDPTGKGSEAALGLLVHEIFHQYCARVRFVEPGGGLSADLLASDGVHWSFLLDSGASLMYGNAWHDNGDGSFTSIDAFRNLGPLDLYLAGLIGPEQVPPLVLIDSPGTDPDQLPRIGVTLQGTARTVTIDDIIAAEGPRVPGVEDSPHRLDAAFVLLIRPGDAVDEETLARLAMLRQSLSGRLAALTGGRAALDVRLPGDPTGGAGSPTPTTGGDPRPGPADVGDALAWLRSRQEPEGSWQDTAETSPRDTATVLATLNALDPLFSGAPLAVSWIQGRPAGRSTDELARSLAAVLDLRSPDHAGLVASLEAELVAAQGDDGGWGVEPSLESDPLDTAVALLALARCPDVPAGVLDAAATFLESSQAGDGGWWHHLDGASRIPVTTTVIEALDTVDRGAAAPAALAWLAARQRSHGGFGDSTVDDPGPTPDPSVMLETAHDTARAVLSFIRHDALDLIDASAAITFLQQGQDTAGSWEGSTATTALVADTLKRLAFPNWSLAQGLIVAPVDPRDGDVVRVEAELVNDGNAPAPAGAVRLYDGDPAASGVLVAEQALPAMDPGATRQLTFHWDTLDAPGTHTLLVVVDPDGLVAELSETDNQASASLEVEAAPAGVDLMLGSVMVVPSLVDTLPTELQLTGIARNLGRTAAGPVTVSVWLGEPLSGSPLETAVVDLPARGTAPLSFVHTLSAPGACPLALVIDPDDQVAEADETNNTAAVLASTVSRVDLAVHADSLALEGEPWLGHDVVLHSRLDNPGTVEVPDARVRFVITDGTTETELQAGSVPMPAGARIDRSITWRVDRLGALRFEVRLDPDDLVAEADEANNVAGLDLVAVEPAGANLAVVHEDMSFDPNPALEGTSLTLSAVLRNTGADDLTDVEVGFFDGDPSTGGLPLGDRVVVPSLAAGEATVVSTVVAAMAGAGEHVIHVVADPDDVVAELDESDNTAFELLDVLSLPDLALSAASLSVDPRFPEPGAEVQITVAVANLGQQDATGVTVRLLADGSTVLPEPTLALVPAGGSAQAVFTWTLPDSEAPVLLHATADPDSTVAEGDETNNVAELELTPADSDQALSNRYLSPNGDGVKDTTTLLISLPEPGTFSVEIEDTAGRLVRRVTGLPANPDGTFEWDGRDGSGTVVADGEYRVVALDDRGGIVREGLATVDTNRSPLIDALGTPMQGTLNLTCGLPRLGSPKVNAAEEWIYLERVRPWWDLSQTDKGYSRLPLAGGALDDVLLTSDASWAWAVTDDDTWLAHQLDGSTNGLRAVPIGGSGELLVPDASWASLDIAPGTRNLVWAGPRWSFPPPIMVRPLDGSGPERQVTAQGCTFFPGDVSPDGRYLACEADDGSGTAFLQTVDLASGATFHLMDEPPADWSTPTVSWTWSPDGSRLAVLVMIDDGWSVTGSVVVLAPDGTMLGWYDIPLVPMSELDAYSSLDLPDPGWWPDLSISKVLGPTWSGSSDELALGALYTEQAGSYEGTYGRIMVATIGEPQLRTVAWLEPQITRFSYHVSSWDGSGWVEHGLLHFGARYAAKELDLGAAWVDPAAGTGAGTGQVRVRVRQSGHDAAHADRIVLRWGPADRPEERVPDRVVDTATGSELGQVLHGADREVADLHEREVELVFTGVPLDEAERQGLRLAMVAREESLDRQQVRPFRYPADPGQVLTWVVQDTGGLVVDGEQTPADQLGEPLFVQWSRPGTGHPAADVVGHVTADAETLYLALDFTVDNTLDGDRDWAELEVRTPDGWRSFRVTASDRAWGVAGFTRTARVDHTHKYYELAVPLAELGAGPGTALDLVVEAYGTAAQVPDSGFLPDNGEDLDWIPGSRSLLYSTLYGAPSLIELDAGNRTSVVLDRFDGINEPFLTRSGQALVFQSIAETLDPLSDCYLPDADLYSGDWHVVSSLANLTAVLRPRLATNGRSVILEGTATDLNFDRFVLEHAQTPAGPWQAIGVPSLQPVVNGRLTTWVPPDTGSAAVRLTVEDRAGNRRRVVARTPAVTSGSTLADISLTPRFLSPNGDGVQDEATLGYRVLEPVHLVITVLNASGDQVRTFVRDHATAGTSYQLVWDGRDDDGLPVPDGDYTIQVQGLSFVLTVDTTPPVVVIDLADALQTVPDPQSGAMIVDVAPALAACSSDAHPLEADVLWGQGETPSAWSELKSLSFSSACDDAGPWTALDIERFVGRSFRLEARDAAGNLAVALTGPGAEELILHRFGPGAGQSVPASPSTPMLLDRTDIVLGLAETVERPLVELAIQLRPVGATDWADAALMTGSISEHLMQLVWDLAGTPLGTDLDLRLRAVDEDGTEHLSNHVRLVRNGIELVGLLDLTDPVLGPHRPALLQALRMARLDGSSPVIWGYEAITAPITGERLILTSEQDPRYLGGVPLSPAGSAPTDGASGLPGTVYVFDGSDLEPCLAYRGVLVASQVNAPDAAPLSSRETSMTLPCLELELELTPAEAPGCDQPAPQTLQVAMRPSSHGPGLRTLTLAVDTPDNVVFNQNLPVSGTTITHTLDTSSLPEGRHPIIAVLDTGEGETLEQRAWGVVDRTPPVVELSSPVAGSLVCGVARDGRTVVDIDGRVEDLGAGLDLRLDRLGSDGQWVPGDATSHQLDPPPWPEEVLAPEPVLVQGLLGTLEDLHGDVTIRLVATDLGGQVRCVETTFTIDGELEGPTLALDHDLISPDGDGVKDQATLAIAAAEPFQLDLTVHQVLTSPTGPQLVEPPLAVLASALPVASSTSLAWSGTDTGGSVVPDGRYALRAVLTDGCGNQLEQQLRVDVDTTPPTVALATPPAGDLAAVMVEVRGTVLDDHLASWSLDLGSGSPPAAWATLAGSTRPVADGLLTLWTTTGLTGVHTLRLAAADLAGTVAATEVQITLIGTGDLIAFLAAEPPVLSPNGDGRAETSTVQLVLHQTADITLEILDTADTVVRTLAANEPLEAGSATRVFDGLDDLGLAVADGDYRVRLVAVDAGGSRHEESIGLAVDREPPVVDILRPAAGFASASGHVRGTITDPHLLDYVAELTDQPDDPEWVELASGVVDVVDGELGSLEGLPEGRYGLRILARDQAFNRREQILGFEIDSTAPEVRLFTPVTGSSVSGAVTVTGEVLEDHPGTYRLEVGSGASPLTWDLLIGGDGLPAWPVAWDTSGLADGPYSLRLIAEDLAGTTASAQVLVHVDGTAPVVALTEPAAGSWVTGPTLVRGTAADDRLAQYVLLTAPAGTGQWVELGRGATSVTDGPLWSWTSLPADGEHLLRLEAVDAAGHRAETRIALGVDTHPPAPPTGLVATVEDGRDVRLTWSPGPETDVVGWHVQRDGLQLTASPVADPAHLDAGLPEGRFTYRVLAVDRAGQQSDLSEPVEVVVDRTAPSAVVHRPSGSEPVAGLVDLKITAAADDLHEYRLRAGGALLLTSPIPAQAEVVAQWDTLAAPDGPATVRLEAEDLRGNVATAEVIVQVDNQPPAAPTGLVATVTGDDVDLEWVVGTEPDLLGSLVLRDGQVLGVPASAGVDLRPWALTGTTSTDLDLADGHHVYTVIAIDTAGNLSAESAPAAVDIDTRPPAARIVDPADGARVDGEVFLVAACDDTDVASVRLQYRATGAPAWTDILIDTIVPWEAIWPTSALAYGDYELRAVATDLASATDPDPALIAVVHTDLERPDPVQDLAARVDGDQVVLTWTASPEPDLAGTLLERDDGTSGPIRLTPSPVAGTTFTDTGVADGSFSYRVIAVDTYDNEADPSQPVLATVTTPLLEPPVSPTAEATLVLHARGAPFGITRVRVDHEDGSSSTVPDVSADGDGLVSMPGVPLAVGRNDLALVIEDRDGNRSKPATAAVLRGVPPSAPTGLAATVSGLDVSLSWSPNPEPDILGYWVHRDGTLLQTPQPVPSSAITSVSATSQAGSAYRAAMAVDGSLGTYWAPGTSSSVPAAGQSIELHWSPSRQISAITAIWSWIDYRAVDFDVQVWHLGSWYTVAQVRGNDVDQNRIDLPGYLDTDGVRILLHAIALPDTDLRPVRLAEVQLEEITFVAGTSLVDPVPADGVVTYTVTALNPLFPSQPSDPLEVGVGDVEPPDPVTLSAVVNGADVQLSWTASPAPDLGEYRVLGDGARIATTTALDHLDTGVLNGEHTYVVRPVDLLGNVGLDSNPVVVTIDEPLPGQPQGLVVTAPAPGGALDLSWTAGPGPAPAAYRVERSAVSGGPYAPVATVSSTSLRDTDVVNGERFYYVVVALDVIGNQSQPSDEASGVPSDTEPPSAPVIVFPATATSPLVTNDPLLPTLSGMAEPGSAVSIRRRGFEVAGVVASAEPEVLRFADTIWNVPSLSPDGRRLWIDRSSSPELIDLETGERQSLSSLWGFGAASWLASSSSVVIAELRLTGGGELYTYHIADGRLEPLAQTGGCEIAVPAPDGSALAVLGSPIDSGLGGPALWHLNLASGAWSLLAPAAALEIEPSSIAFSPDGAHIAYLRTAPERRLELVDVATGLVRDVAAPGCDTLDWAPDGAAVLYSAADGSGHLQLWAFNLSDGSTRRLTGDAADHLQGVWSPDGRGVVFAWNGLELRQQPVDGSEPVALLSLIAFDGVLQRAPSAHLLLVDEHTPVRLDPAGRFEATFLALDAGDNPFTASATDVAGNPGPESDPAVVVLTSDGRADLVVTPDDLGVVPPVPVLDQATRLTVTLRNTGVVATPPTALSMVMSRPDGSSVELGGGLGLGAIPAGGSETRAVDLVLAAGPGTYRLLVVADPLDRVLEVSESNNRAVRDIVVVAEAGPVVSLSTDRETYATHDTVRIDLDVLNGGPTLNGTVDLRIEDLDGYPAAILPQITISGLAYGATLSRDLVWDTGDIFSGDYRVRARLHDADGIELADEQAPFAVSDPITVNLTLASDRPTYAQGATVTLAASLAYTQGSTVLDSTTARLRLLDPSGTLVTEWSEPLGTLLPGATASFDRIWSSSGAVAGTYRAELELVREMPAPDPPVSLGTATAVLEILPGELALDATLVVAPEAVAVGVGLDATYRITNRSTIDVVGMPVRLLLLDPERSTVLATVEHSLDLPAGASAGGTAGFATSGLQVGAYLVLLQADLPAALLEPGPAILASAGFSTLDRTPPELSLVRPADGGLLGLDARAIVRAADSLSRVSTVQLSLDAGPWLPAAGMGQGTDHWYRSLGSLLDGPHQLEAEAVDQWGNTARIGPLPFIADQTPPLILISGVEDGLTYTAPVIPVFTVVDDNPDTVSAILNGVPFTSGTQVADQGVYSLVVSATDAAGNTSEASVRFTLGAPPVPDLTATKVDILAVDADGDGSVSPGDQLEYSLQVQASGEGTLSSLVVEDPIPARTSLVPGSLTTTAGTIAGLDPIQIVVGELSAGTTIRITFRVRIDGPFDPGTWQITNQAITRSDQLADLLSDDPDLPGLTDPTLTELVITVPVPELQATKTGAVVDDLLGDGDASPGDTIEYAITITNLGDGDATAVTFLDDIPANTTVVPGSLTCSSCDLLGQSPVEAWLGTVAPGAIVDIRFQVLLDDMLPAGVDTISNQGRILSDELPVVLTDDPDTPDSGDPTVLIANNLGARAEIPVLSGPGLLLLTVLILGLGLLLLRRSSQPGLDLAE